MGLIVPTPRASYYETEMIRHFPLLLRGGIGVCKNITGDGPSQHSWGNACDLMVPYTSYGLKAYDYAKSNSAVFGIAHLLYDPAGAPGAVVGQHNNHIHADFYPQGVGLPPCMGGSLRWGSDPVASASPDRKPNQKGRAPNAADARAGARPGAANYQPQTGGIPNPFEAIGLLAKAVGFLADPHNWLRLGEIIAGGILMGGGLILISEQLKETDAGKQLMSQAETIGAFVK